MVNKVIVNRVKKIEEYLRRLKEIRKAKKEQFLTDWKLQDLALRNLQVCIEACIDIGNHLITMNRWEVPETYAETMEILKRHRIIGEELAVKMGDLVKFRNIIVHDYLYLDMEKVYRNLQRIKEIEEFISQVIRNIKE